MSIESENGGVKKPIMPVKIGKPATVNVEDSNIENESSNEEKDKNEDNSSVTGNDTSESNESSNETNEDNDTNEVEIDGEIYNLDSEGNATKYGNIVFTKEQISSMNEINSDDSLESEVSENASVELISNLSGIVPLDDNGEPISYEWSAEGLAKRESDIYQIGLANGFKTNFDKFLKDNPDIAAIIDYKSRFGTIEGYNSSHDYIKMTVPDDEDAKFRLIYDAEIQRGNSPERAKRIAEFAKTNNTLDEDAQISLEFLKKNQEAAIEQRRKEVEDAQRELFAKELAFYGVDYSNGKETVIEDAKGSLYDCIVNNGSLKNYTIPIEGINIKTDKGIKKISRKELFDYISKPVKEIDGNYYTQAQLDELKQLSNPEEYALRCIMNLNGGIDSLIERKAVDKEIKRLRSLTSTKNTSKARASKLGETNGEKVKLNLPIKTQK